MIPNIPLHPCVDPLLEEVGEVLGDFLMMYKDSTTIFTPPMLSLWLILMPLIVFLQRSRLLLLRVTGFNLSVMKTFPSNAEGALN